MPCDDSCDGPVRFSDHLVAGRVGDRARIISATAPTPRPVSIMV
jgi:hypothetical protein